jgi:hypothetical protein
MPDWSASAGHANTWGQAEPTGPDVFPSRAPGLDIRLALSA